jgi:hypothetical protein
MTLADELYDIEEGFWLEGREHFLSHLDSQVLLAFPQTGQMHGVFTRDEVAATATPDNRWRNLAMRDRQLLEWNEVAIISYRAEVFRADGAPYAALVSSAYVRRNGEWKLAFHQHSPV